MNTSGDRSLMEDVVRANRILANEGVLDGFGHVSARLDSPSSHFVISRSRAPELVEFGDLHVFGEDSEPVDATGVRMFAERVIHGEVYRARPDVMAVCHHHAASMLPFCITDVPLVSAFHLGATQGMHVPVWDSQDEFGDTNLLVSTREQGASLARALGSDWTVLMRRHGVTVAARSVRELVFRCIYGARNAEIILRATSLGKLSPLTAGETRLAGEFNLGPLAVDRAWEQWCRRAGT